MWLEATALQLAVQPVTPLTMFGLLDADSACLSDHEQRDLHGVAGALAELLPTWRGAPIAIIRLHRGSGLAPVAAGRRTVDDVLVTMGETA